MEESSGGQISWARAALDRAQQCMSSFWALQHDWEIFPMSNGIFIFRFSTDDDRDHVLLAGPWVVDDAVLALSP